jgi:hypothetical protein
MLFIILFTPSIKDLINESATTQIVLLKTKAADDPSAAWLSEHHQTLALRPRFTTGLPFRGQNYDN